MNEHDKDVIAHNLTVQMINKLGWEATGAERFEELQSVVADAMRIEDNTATLVFWYGDQEYTLTEKV